ncbi:unnamed protein product [Bursaphelenchus xylophilus]|uniref:(pine wood nematode) hypothetical protein n=1 Tax=Bursaphelenchus xylophilus TaxID=6326 RepID=A0A1I7S119_BURXY|nr:unnamed protein product [Bursaphelenchus xylophilus]CAG9088027.1 unnamed protein product [Bursaphelenchus xylophilus]
MGFQRPERVSFGMSEMFTSRIPRYCRRKTSRSTDLSTSSTNSFSSADSHNEFHRRFERIVLSSQNMISYKTQYCRSFRENGDCAYGGNCRFAHGEDELRIQSAQFHPKYKTRQCRNYLTKGHCHYGINCQFIHDETIEQISLWRRNAFSHSGLSKDNMDEAKLQERTKLFVSVMDELQPIFSNGLRTMDIGLREDPFLKLKWNKNVPHA